MGKRLNYIDGIKGIACIGVMAFHYKMVFCNVFWGIDYLSEKVDIVNNGLFYVRIFFVISAFLIAKSLYSNINVEKISDIIIKRYLRLSLPIFIVTLMIWFLMQTDIFSNNLYSTSINTIDNINCYQTKENILSVFTTSFCTTIFNNDSTFNGTFWMISRMFWGDLLAIGIVTLTYKKSKLKKIIFFVAIVLSLLLNNDYISFVLGTKLAYDLINNDKRKKLLNNILCIFGVVLGLLLVEFNGYIIEITNNNIDYDFFLNNIGFYYAISATFILKSIINSNILQKIFSLKLFTKIGSVSYYVYLIHFPIICSISRLIFKNIYRSENFVFIARVVFIITLILVMLVSLFLTKFYDRLCNRLTSSILKHKNMTVE